MTLADTIKEKVKSYVSNNLNLQQFNDWFRPVLRDAYGAGDPDGEKLAHAVEWVFFDCKRLGEKSEDTLKKNLSQLVADFEKYQQARPSLLVTSFLLRREYGLPENRESSLLHDKYVYPSAPKGNTSASLTDAFVEM